MSKSIEFGSKDGADSFREEFDEWVCPVDDDRRLKTVALMSDTPESVVEHAETEAAAGRGEREGDGGQVDLTDRERDRLDFSKGRANVMWARSIKGIARSEGVDDWLAHVDPSLTVDEHRDVMARAARDDRGRRLDAEETADEKLARAEGGQCDHARGHCEHGDPDACEFLTEACGYDKDEIQSLLSDFGEDVTEFDDLPGEVKGALSRAWQGYRIGVGLLADLLDDVAEEMARTEEAAAAIAAIETRLPDETSEFRALAAHHEHLADLARNHSPRDHGQPDPERDGDDQQDDRDDHPLLADDRDGDRDDEGPTEWEDQSREFRAAQQDGYLRKGTEEKTASDRDGLGQFGAAPSDTKRLSDLQDTQE